MKKFMFIFTSFRSFSLSSAKCSVSPPTYTRANCVLFFSLSFRLYFDLPIKKTKAGILLFAFTFYYYCYVCFFRI